MGFFGDIKKMLFGGKSLAKSGYEKVKEESKDLAESALEKGAELKDRAEEKIDDLVEAFTGGEERTVTIAEEDIAESLQEVEKPKAEVKSKTEEVLENIGEKAMELGEDITEKAEVIGQKVSEKFGETAEKLGEKIYEGKDALVEKAKSAGEILERKLDETLEKAKELDAQIERESLDKDGDSFADEAVDLGGSLLEGTDDFFEKAKSFAEGKPMTPGETVIRKGDLTIQEGPQKEEEDSSKEQKIYGFEDRDGDGNEIVDDAIIEEE